MGKVYLLMTGTIAPHNCPDAQFSEVERKRRYLRAFEFYLRKLSSSRCSYDGIVFAENSDADLAEFCERIPGDYRSCVEIISAPAKLFPEYLGKNNEFGLIDYAVDHSKLLQGDCCAGFFKVTGRYYFRNIVSLVNEVRSLRDIDLFCDQRDHRLYSRLGLKRKERDGDTRLFFSSITFWKSHFYAYFKHYPTWRRVEDLMFEVAVGQYGNEKCRFRFLHEPLLCGNGYSKSEGRYIVSMGIRWNPRLFFMTSVLRWGVESVLRRILPNFWF